MKKIGLVLTIFFTTLIGLNIYTNNNAKAEDANHTLTIKKETVNNKQGEFTYRVKVWKEILDTNSYKDTYTEIVEMGGMDGDHDQTWAIDFPDGTIYQGKEFNGHYEIAKETYSDSDIQRLSDGSLIVGWKWNHEDIDGYYNPMNYDEETFHILIDLMKKVQATPSVFEPGESWTYIDDITIDGVEYPFFVSGFNAEGNTHEYLAAISEYEKVVEYLDISSSHINSTTDEGVYEFKLNQGSEKTISIPEGYSYEVIEMPKENWQLENINGDSSLTKAEGTMTSDKEYTFKNKKTTYDIIVHHYKENTTEKLGADEKILDKQNGYNYTTSPLSNIPEGYELVGTPSNASGTVENDVIVIYEYKLKDVELTIKYVDEEGNEISSVKEPHKYGDSYTTTPMENDEYELVTTPTNANGTIKESTTVTYVYKKKEVVPETGTITVKYVDSDGNEISSSEVTTKEVGTSYISKPKEIEGYVIKEKPSTESYTYTKEGQTVTYVYERMRLKVSTKVRNNIGGNIEGDEEVLYGNNSTAGKIHIKANNGYVINKVYINGSEIEIPKDSTELNISNFIKMNEDKLVEVEFKEIKKDLVVKVPPTSAQTIYTILGMLGLISVGVFGIYYNKKLS